MPKKMACMFPRPEGTTTWLYLVGGHDGMVKVGRTRWLKSRITCHRRAMGENFAWAHVFSQKESGDAEYSAKLELSSLGSRVRRTEMFFGVSKADAISLCRRLVHERAEIQAGLRRQVAERKREQDAWRAFRAQYVEATEA